MILSSRFHKILESKLQAKMSKREERATPNPEPTNAQTLVPGTPASNLKSVTLGYLTGQCTIFNGAPTATPWPRVEKRQHGRPRTSDPTLGVRGPVRVLVEAQ